MDPWIMAMMDDNQPVKKLGRQTTILIIVYCLVITYTSRSIDNSPSDSNTEPYRDMPRDHVNKQVMASLQLSSNREFFVSSSSRSWLLQHMSPPARGKPQPVGAGPRRTWCA